MDCEYQGYTYKIYSDGKSTIIATATYAGKTVRGVAKCDPQDEFDYEKGATLAVVRCALKIAKKRLKRSKERLHNATTTLDWATKYLNESKEFVESANEEVRQISKNLEEIKTDF